MRTKLFTIVCVLLVSVLAFGQAKSDRDTKRLQQQKVQRDGGATCGSDPILPTDGSSVQDYVGSIGPNYYLLHLKGGHSYSAEMWDPADLYIGGGAKLALLTSPGCSPSWSTDLVGVDPDLHNNFADRISWDYTSDHDVVLEASSLDSSGAFYTYVIRVTDTTLWNPNWSTYSTLAVQYDFTNVTASTLSGKLTVTDVTGGGTTYSASFSVPAGKQVSKIVAATGIASTGLQVPANHQGYASFVFVGPAGAILADAYFINNTTPNVPVTPAKFEPRFFPH